MSAGESRRGIHPAGLQQPARRPARPGQGRQAMDCRLPGRKKQPSGTGIATPARSDSTRCSATTSRSPTPHSAKIPADYIRKQTVKNARSSYITPELKEYEEKVLSADEKAKEPRIRAVSGTARIGGGRAHRRLQATARPCCCSWTCWSPWPSRHAAAAVLPAHDRRRAAAQADCRRPPSGARRPDPG